MRSLLVIGIGAGDPDYLTVQAIAAIRATDVFLFVDKGKDKNDLIALRELILNRHRDDAGYEVVPIVEPPRDRSLSNTSEQYQGAIGDWHERRAELFEQVIATRVPDGGTGAFLVWGDPALYDSTLRVIDRILTRGGLELDYRVIPGITAVQALAARHRQPINRIGEPVHITTGRRLAAGVPTGLDAVVVMLDAGLACQDWTDPGWEIFWGAYLGTPDEVLLSGRLVDVAAQILQAKRTLKATHGWIMDTYLLRRSRAAE